MNFITLFYFLQILRALSFGSTHLSVYANRTDIILIGHDHHSDIFVALCKFFKQQQQQNITSSSYNNHNMPIHIPIAQPILILPIFQNYQTTL